MKKKLREVGLGEPHAHPMYLRGIETKEPNRKVNNEKVIDKQNDSWSNQ